MNNILLKNVYNKNNVNVDFDNMEEKHY